MKTPLVVYHSPCLDGFTAAWACWLVNPDWEYVGGIHGESLDLSLFADRDVYFLDFSYKRPRMEAVIAVAKSVTVLDHHVSAKLDLEELFDTNQIKGKFDMNHSGAYLSWEFFHPTEEVPTIVLLVEDRDIWRQPRRYGETDAFNAYAFSFDYTFEKWTFLYKDSLHHDRFMGMLSEGNAILRKQARDVKALVDHHTYTAIIGDYPVPCINVPYMYASDAGHIMCQGKPFAASYFYNGEKYQFSLRSAEDGIDVSEIAKKYGGGGHKHAAGFQVCLLEEL